MKVILTQDVKKLGVKGDLVEVAEGYGRNFLIPRGLAVEATRARMRDLTHREEVEEKKRTREEEDARALAEKLDALQIELPAKTGESGRLFGSITSQDIANAIKAAIDVEVDRRRIELPEPIRTLGTYRIPVRVYAGVVGTVTAKVKEA